MDHEVRAAMLAYIDALHRSVDVNEKFADHLVALARVIEGDLDRGGTPDTLLDLARRHRVDAIKGRSRIAAVSQQFVRRFGTEPFQPEG